MNCSSRMFFAFFLLFLAAIPAVSESQILDFTYEDTSFLVEVTGMGEVVNVEEGTGTSAGTWLVTTSGMLFDNISIPRSGPMGITVRITATDGWKCIPDQNPCLPTGRQEAGAMVGLWRYLWESDGGWFWWRNESFFDGEFAVLKSDFSGATTYQLGRDATVYARVNITPCKGVGYDAPYLNLSVAFQVPASIARRIEEDGGRGGPSGDQGIPWDPPPVGGGCGFPAYLMNMAFLNLVVQDTEFAVQSLGPGLATTRTWNSTSSGAGIFGNGWSFPYESTLRKFCGGAEVLLGSGKSIVYNADLCPASGSLIYPVEAVAPEGVIDKLTYMSEDYWLLKNKDSRQTYRYDPVGQSIMDIYRLTSITDQNGNTLKVLYNSGGTIEKVIDAAGREMTFIYTDKRVSALETPDGGQVIFGYDAQGNLIRTVDLFGTEILYEYDSEKYMTAMSYAGKTIRYTYDTTAGWKHVAAITDANGAVRTYAGTTGYSSETTVTDARGGTTTIYSSSGKAATTLDASGNRTDSVYAVNGLPVSVTYPKGNKVTMEYDARGNMTKKTDALGKITTYSYDADDNLITSTNPLGEIWTYAYDGKNNLTSIKSPAGKLTSFTYDTKGQLTGMTDANGHSTTYTCDSFGNRQTITDALGKTTTFGYDSAGINRISALDPKGNKSSFSYDQNRRLTRITHADGTHIDFSYDACAMTGIRDENGHNLSYSRDKMLRITEITDAMNAVSKNAYDGNGNLVTTTDPLLKIVSMTYDAVDRLATITDPSGGSVLFMRDANGNITAVRDERLKQTAFTFDANDRLLSTTDPLGRVVNVTLDDMGRRKQQKNARGALIGTAYDSEGRLTAKTYGAATAATYSCDSAGNLISFTDDSGITTYTYNARNEITRIGYPDGKAVTFAYDAAGNMVTTNYPGGLALTLGISNRNRIQTMQWDTSSVSFGYDASGNLLSETRSNGTSSDYLYDANDQLTSIRHKKGASEIASMDYTRNAVGNIVSESATLPAVISLTNRNDSGMYDNANQISSFGGSTYSHDADGNLTGITGKKTFTGVYDPENRPVQMTSGGVTASYTYDALGNRVQAVRAAQTTRYYYDYLGRLLFDTDGSGNVVNYYLYKGERLVSMRSAAGGSYFYHFDKTGNTVAITNESGNTVNAYAYTPYGEIAGSTEAVANRFKYVGAYGVMDEGSGIYFMKNRYYDAATGRFLQKDPIGFVGGQTNLYAYVGNNPVNHIDPSGLLTEAEIINASRDMLIKRVIGDIIGIAIGPNAAVAWGFANLANSVGKGVNWFLDYKEKCQAPVPTSSKSLSIWNFAQSVRKYIDEKINGK